MSQLAFEKFYVEWQEEIRIRFSELREALQLSRPEEEIERQVQACYSLYGEYTREKMKLCREDVSFVVAGMWRTSLEAGFSWMGGWRPTTAVVLAYSLMGLQIESDLQKLLQGIELPSMAALSAEQLSNLDSLQQRIRVSEDELSDRLAVVQMLVADQHIARATAAIASPVKSDDLSDAREALKPKLASLCDLLVEAQNLRTATLGEMLDILGPVQAGQYALAAYEMAAAVQNLGNQKEAQISSVSSNACEH